MRFGRYVIYKQCLIACYFIITIYKSSCMLYAFRILKSITFVPWPFLWNKVCMIHLQYTNCHSLWIIEVSRASILNTSSLLTLQATKLITRKYIYDQKKSTVLLKWFHVYRAARYKMETVRTRRQLGGGGHRWGTGGQVIETEGVGGWSSWWDLSPGSDYLERKGKE